MLQVMSIFDRIQLEFFKFYSSKFQVFYKNKEPLEKKHHPQNKACTKSETHAGIGVFSIPFPDQYGLNNTQKEWKKNKEYMQKE